MDYLEVLLECAESYYESTQLPLSVLKCDGTLIREFGVPCSYCRQFKKMVGSDEGCSKRHMHGCIEAAKLNKGYVFSCPGGLLLFAVSLKKDGKHIYSILGGPMLPETPQIDMVDDILTRMAMPLTGRGTLYSALKTVPMLEPRRIEYLNRLLHNLTTNLLDSAPQVLQRAQEKSAEDARVDAYLKAIQETKQPKEDSNQLHDLEEQLVSAIRIGNKADAKDIMEHLFCIRSIHSGMQTNLTTIHAIELLTLLSRTAINAGANVHTMYKLTDRMFCQLMEARSVNQVSYLLQKSVEEAINKIDLHEVEETTALIRQSIYFIRQHYKENLTLESVAGKVGLSPSYFSTIFKEKTGVSFTSYVNNLKTEAAKILLYEADLSLADISVILGFCSQSYFSSVFKKNVGMSPKQYQSYSSVDFEEQNDSLIAKTV